MAELAAIKQETSAAQGYFVCLVFISLDMALTLRVAE